MTATRRFPCSPEPARRAGRRRLAIVLALLAATALAAAVFAWTRDRTWPAILAAIAAWAPLFAWRMSGDLDPVELWLDNGRLTIRTRRHLIRRPFAGATARRLRHEEVSHLRRLTSSAGFLTSAGGFDSHLLGEFDLYASDLDHALLVEIGDERLIVTPDDPRAFLEALERAA